MRTGYVDARAIRAAKEQAKQRNSVSFGITKGLMSCSKCDCANFEASARDGTPTLVPSHTRPIAASTFASGPVDCVSDVARHRPALGCRWEWWRSNSVASGSSLD
jgi:hypothetical protein